MIYAHNLTKIYRTHTRQANILKDIFNRQYKEHTALHNISFTIGNSELVGFIGPNGAGKTTTLKILAGILYPTSGKVRVLNQNPFDKKPSYLKQIAFILGQRNQLIWDLAAKDTFLLQKEIYEIDDAKYHKQVGVLTELLKCKHLVDKPVKTLSLGERMKMELIAGLLHNPRLIFFDEPTIGLDIFSQEAVREFIRSYQQEFKSTIILTSHYLEDVRRLAKRLIVINEGNIVYDGTLHKVIEQYSRNKRINLSLNKRVSYQTITKISKPIIYSFPKLEFHIPNELLQEKIHQISQTLPFDDMTVENETIEEIIKEVLGK